MTCHGEQLAEEQTMGPSMATHLLAHFPSTGGMSANNHEQSFATHHLPTTVQCQHRRSTQAQSLRVHTLLPGPFASFSLLATHLDGTTTTEANMIAFADLFSIGKWN